MRILTITLTLFLSAFAFKANASEVVKFCTTCTSEGNFYSSALAEANIRVSKIRVYNPTTGVLRVYRVEVEPFEPGYENRGGISIYRVSPTSADLQKAYQISAAYNSLIDYFESNKEVPASFMESGYDIIGDRVNQQRLQDFYNSDSTYGQKYTQLLQSMAAFGRLVSIDFNIELTFSDGMVATFAVVRRTDNGDLNLILKAMKDAHGNDIAVTLEEANAQKDQAMSFETTGEIREHLRAMGRFGIDYVFVPNFGGGSSSITDIICDVNGRCRRLN